MNQQTRGIFGPLIDALLPLLDGLTRRHLRRRGVAQHSARIIDTTLNYYAAAPAGPAADEALPILLVHGIADSALTWAGMLPLLARSHPVYAVDLPGYGFSGLPPKQAFATVNDMCQMLETFVRTVIGRPALVVGSSLGGWLAVRLAAAAPEQVRGIVLLNPGGARLEGAASWQEFAEIIQVRDPKAARQLFLSMFGMSTPPLAYLGQRAIQQLFRRNIVREFAAAVQESEFLGPEELAELTVPVALVWGLSDRFLPPASLAFFRDALPDAQHLLLPRVGHLPQRERPRTVARFVLGYGQQLALTASRAAGGTASVKKP